jgi:NADH dehydrogenase FAD-containing subunit
VTKSNTITSAAAHATPYTLVLAGGGHAHLVALRQWVKQRWQAPPGSILINPDTLSWYSGMMPGLIAGRFMQTDCAVSLASLCEATGIELCLDEVLGVDALAQQLRLASGRLLAYQCLSLNTGSLPLSIEHSDGSLPEVAAKPFSGFIQHFRQWQASPPAKGLAVVGGGAAAFELALALRTSLPTVPVSLLSGQVLLASHAAGVRRRAISFLAAANISLYEACAVTHISDGSLLSHGRVICKADAVVLATGAGALPWYKESGLDTDDAGFIRVSATLQSIGNANVFAAGDSASLPGSQRSGVYAVRHGAVLRRNIPALINQQALVGYRPQKQALALLATTDGGALMSYAGFSAQGRLPGLWKDYLDTSFIRKHQFKKSRHPA